MLQNLRPCRSAFCAVAVAAALLAGCAGFNPQPYETLSFQDRALTRSQDSLTISAVALGPSEAQAAFGVNMFGAGVQPIWLRVTNDGRKDLILAPLFSDRLYFTPAEAAFVNHGWFSSGTNAKIDGLFEDRALPVAVNAGQTVEGFLYGTTDLGQKALNFVYVGERTQIHTSFVVPVPGLEMEPVDFANLYPPDHIRDVTTAAELKTAIEALPCCVTDKSGKIEADPLNFVIVAEPQTGLAALVAGGWDQVETVTSASAFKTTMSFVFGSAYRYSPVSDLYLFGRKQDAAFQIARANIHQRNHLRVWLTPLTFRGTPVWVGAISRDIGVIMSGFGTTHKIDPNVDEERWYLAQSLALAQALKRFAFAAGAPVSTPERPRSSVEPDNIFYSDGLRIVLEISTEPVPLDEIRYIRWEGTETEPPGIVRERAPPG
jgi:hypothetical protein